MSIEGKQQMFNFRIIRDFSRNSGIFDNPLNFLTKVNLYKNQNQETVITMSHNKLTPTVIGIDIGALTTKVAAVQRGAIDILTNEANFRETPSIVGYGSGERKIGQAGNVKLKSNFKNTIVSPMRYLSSGSSDKQLIYNPSVSKNENQVIFKVKDFENKDMTLRSEQVLASYLTHLNKMILQNELDAKVITIAVPSYFSETEKQAVLNAAQISQMNSRINIVQDNVAIGLDYGVFKKNQLQKNEKGKYVCFVDFGHSKLSASVIKYLGNGMQVLLQKYNRNLGCKDIDQKLFQHFSAIFKQKTGLDLYENKKACLKLLEVIQRQRKILTGIQESQISIECLMEDEDINEPISRELIKKVAEQIFEEFKNLLTGLKSQLNKQNIKLDEIELVGGGTRIPAIIELIHEIFEMQPSRTMNSSQCISKGATLASVQKSGLFRLHTLKVQNKLSHKICAEMQGENIAVFEQNQVMPQQKSIELELKGNIQLCLKSQLKAQVFENLLKAKFSIEDQPSNQIQIEEEKPEQKSEQKLEIEEQKLDVEEQPNPSSKVSILFTLNPNGFINIKQITHKNKKIEFETIKYYELPKNKIQQFKSIQRSMFVRDYQITKAYQQKNRLESCIYKNKQIVNSDSIQQYLKDEDKESLEQYFQNLSDSIQDDNKLTVKDYQDKLVEVQMKVGQAKKIVEEKKKEISNYFEELSKLQKAAVDTLNQISSKYRNTRAVSQVYAEIKEVHDWAAQAIEKSKKSKVSQLPLVNKQSIEKQYNIIRESVKSLTTPPPNHHQPAHNNPFGYQTPRYQQQQPQRQRYQDYDPFRMSRSSFFPSNNFFGGFF